MKKFVLAAAMALLFAVPFASAQPLPPGKWWRRPEIIKVLALTNEQQDRLDEVFRKKADELIDTKAEVDKLQISLRGELDRSQLRRAEIQRIARSLNDARARLFESELMMLVDMRSVLTESQWEKMRNHLERLDQQRRGNRQEMRENGPPPRRPRP
ncbi:MAG TPA: periplasmic heavy metal sensor [Thermoanaerobaculia bacterium]|nr:periplasmic heavy metal sensor [Thermoanaerobaculia bacterium]